MEPLGKEQLFAPKAGVHGGNGLWAKLGGGENAGDGGNNSVEGANSASREERLRRREREREQRRRKPNATPMKLEAPSETTISSGFGIYGNDAGRGGPGPGTAQLFDDSKPRLADLFHAVERGGMSLQNVAPQNQQRNHEEERAGERRKRAYEAKRQRFQVKSKESSNALDQEARKKPVNSASSGSYSQEQITNLHRVNESRTIQPLEPSPRFAKQSNRFEDFGSTSRLLPGSQPSGDAYTRSKGQDHPASNTQQYSSSGTENTEQYFKGGGGALKSLNVEHGGSMPGSDLANSHRQYALDQEKHIHDSRVRQGEERGLGSMADPTASIAFQEHPRSGPSSKPSFAHDLEFQVHEKKKRENQNQFLDRQADGALPNSSDSNLMKALDVRARYAQDLEQQIHEKKLRDQEQNIVEFRGGSGEPNHQHFADIRANEEALKARARYAHELEQQIHEKKLRDQEQNILEYRGGSGEQDRQRFFDARANEEALNARARYAHELEEQIHAKKLRDEQEKIIERGIGNAAGSAFPVEPRNDPSNVQYKIEQPLQGLDPRKQYAKDLEQQIHEKKLREERDKLLTQAKPPDDRGKASSKYRYTAETESLDAQAKYARELEQQIHEKRIREEQEKLQNGVNGSRINQGRGYSLSPHKTEGGEDPRAQYARELEQQIHDKKMREEREKLLSRGIDGRNSHNSGFDASQHEATDARSKYARELEQQMREKRIRDEQDKLRSRGMDISQHPGQMHSSQMQNGYTPYEQPGAIDPKAKYARDLEKQIREKKLRDQQQTMERRVEEDYSAPSPVAAHAHRNVNRALGWGPSDDDVKAAKKMEYKRFLEIQMAEKRRREEEERASRRGVPSARSMGDPQRLAGTGFNSQSYVPPGTGHLGTQGYDPIRGVQQSLHLQNLGFGSGPGVSNGGVFLPPGGNGGSMGYPAYNAGNAAVYSGMQGAPAGYPQMHTQFGPGISSQSDAYPGMNQQFGNGMTHTVAPEGIGMPGPLQDFTSAVPTLGMPTGYQHPLDSARSQGALSPGRARLPRFTRLNVDPNDPAVQAELAEKKMKQMAQRNELLMQMEMDQERKAREKKDRERQEKEDEERLARERLEIQEALDREKDAQKKKQEHQEQLEQQIAEKKRQREEEELQRKREEEAEDERIARERKELEMKFKEQMKPGQEPIVQSARSHQPDTHQMAPATEKANLFGPPSPLPGNGPGNLRGTAHLFDSPRQDPEVKEDDTDALVHHPMISSRKNSRKSMSSLIQAQEAQEDGQQRPESFSGSTRIHDNALQALLKETAAARSEQARTLEALELVREQLEELKQDQQGGPDVNFHRNVLGYIPAPQPRGRSERSRRGILQDTGRRVVNGLESPLERSMDISSELGSPALRFVDSLFPSSPSGRVMSPSFNEDHALKSESKFILPSGETFDSRNARGGQHYSFSDSTNTARKNLLSPVRGSPKSQVPQPQSPLYSRCSKVNSGNTGVHSTERLLHSPTQENLENQHIKGNRIYSRNPQPVKGLHMLMPQPSKRSPPAPPPCRSQNKYQNSPTKSMHISWSPKSSSHTSILSKSTTIVRGDYNGSVSGTKKKPSDEDFDIYRIHENNRSRLAKLEQIGDCSKLHGDQLDAFLEDFLDKSDSFRPLVNVHPERNLDCETRWLPASKCD